MQTNKCIIYTIILKNADKRKKYYRFKKNERADKMLFLNLILFREEIAFDKL